MLRQVCRSYGEVLINNYETTEFHQRGLCEEPERDPVPALYFDLRTFLRSVQGYAGQLPCEVVAMGEMDRGITEFFRELPGIALVFILAAFYMLSAETLYKVGAVIMLLGMGMHAVLPPLKILTTLAI